MNFEILGKIKMYFNLCKQ